MTKKLLPGLRWSRTSVCTVALVLIAISLLLTGLFVAEPAAAASTRSVKDFGAVGNGAADDSGAIQAAIDACSAGDTLLIPQGTYVVTKSIFPKSGITIQGVGDTSVIKFQGGTDYSWVIWAKNCSNLTLRDFKVDGNAASATITGTGEQRHNVMLDGCSDSVVERVITTQSLGDGIFLWRGCVRITVRNCTAIAGITSNARVGINFQGASDSLITGNYVQGYDTAYKAEIDENDGNSVNVRVVGNTNSGGQNPIVLNGSVTGRCIGYVIENNTFSGRIWVNKADNTIIRNNTLTNGDIGVYSAYDNHGLLVQNNSFSGYTYSDLYLAEIYSLGPSDTIRVTGNTFAAGTRQHGIVRHVNSTVAAVEVDNNTYPSGPTLYNPYDGATAYVHDNVLAGSTSTTTSSTTSTTIASTTSTTAPATATTSTTAPATTTTSTTTTTLRTPTTATTTTTTAAPTTTTTAAPTTTTVAPTTTTVAKASGSASVVIKSPADQSTVRGKITISVAVTSSTKIGQVLLYVDGAQVGQDTRAPYSFLWNTASYAAGLHTLACVAFDRLGVELGRASCQVTVSASSTTWLKWFW